MLANHGISILCSVQSVGERVKTQVGILHCNGVRKLAGLASCLPKIRYHELTVCPLFEESFLYSVLFVLGRRVVPDYPRACVRLL